jgi:deoxyribodipyrimidine photo-lyase
LYNINLWLQLVDTLTSDHIEMTKHRTSIFIFRRDYRLHDNIGLLTALKNSDIVLPIFIMTPEQLVDNPYKSDNCVQFMFESLDDLDVQLGKFKSRIHCYYGDTISVLESLVKKRDLEIDAVYVNRDYTPYSTKRDAEIGNLCKKYEIEFVSKEDLLLQPVRSVLTGGGTVYTKFTPFFVAASKVAVNKPVINKYKNYWSNSTVGKEYTKSRQKFYQENESVREEFPGGRKTALKILDKIKDQSKYNLMRNVLTYKTSQLSPYIKFGCVSIREVYHTFVTKLGKQNDLVKQLYWREFYYNISAEYPIIYSKKGAMRPQYNKIKWNKPGSQFEKWKTGSTGFPIIDACMRQLNTIGYMHNRGRLIVSNFLIKIMGINWKEGEKYFAQTLVDYDLPNNNGNWQWGAGSGADSQQYNRVFNPWLQSEKFDPKALYIKKWVPELADVPAEDIHSWHETHTKYRSSKVKTVINYPKPMLDYTEQKKIVQKMYLAIYDK